MKDKMESAFLDGNYQWALKLSEAMLDTQNCETEARVNNKYIQNLYPKYSKLINMINVTFAFMHLSSQKSIINWNMYFK